MSERDLTYFTKAHDIACENIFFLSHDFIAFVIIIVSALESIFFGSSHDYAFEYQAAKSYKQHSTSSILFFLFFFSHYILRSLAIFNESERVRKKKKWREKAFVRGTSNQARWLIEGSFCTYEEEEMKILRNFLFPLFSLTASVAAVVNELKCRTKNYPTFILKN